MKKFILGQIEAHPKLWEIFKFLLVGGTATVIDFFVMGVVLYVWDSSVYADNFFKVFIGGGNPSGWATVVGTASGFLVGLSFNYIFSILFVFRGEGNSSDKAKTARGAILFAVLSAIGLGVHVVGMWLGYNILGINEWVIKVVLTALVLVYNYLSRKFLIFSKKAEVQELQKEAA